MNGIQQGIMGAGRHMGEVGTRFAEFGGHHDGMTIVCMVFGILLWAAVMTALVMSMIALVRYLKKPKAESTDKKAASTDKK
jgi:hypothetical protein